MKQPEQLSVQPCAPHALFSPSICKSYFPPQKKKKVVVFFLVFLHSPSTKFPQGQQDCSAAWVFARGCCHSRMVTPEEGWKLEMLEQWVEQTPGSREQQGTHSGTCSDMSQSLKSVLWSRLG